MAVRHEFLPSYSAIHLGLRPSLSVLLIFLATLCSAGLHESGHYLMARSYGVQAGLKVSHRLYLLVLETDVTNAWPLRQSQRLRIFLAGIMVNFAIVCACVIIGFVTELAYSENAVRWLPSLRLVIFLNTFPLVFQLFVFARTDLYYVLGLALRERNLSNDAMACVKSYVLHYGRRLLRRPFSPCSQCHHAVFRTEQVCFHCGDLRDQAAEGLVTPPSRRGRLVVYGVVAYAGQAAGLYFVFRLVTSLQVLALYNSARAFIESVLVGEATSGQVLDQLVVFVVIGLQLFGLAYFLVRDWWTLLVATTRRIVMRLRTPKSRSLTFAAGSFPQKK